MLKRVLFTLFTLTLTLGLIGCGNASEEPESTEQNQDQGAGEEKTLKVAYPTWWENWFFDLKDDFEEQHDVTVELIALHDDVTTKQAMMMQSEETSPDVAVEDTYIINSDVNAGYLSPIDDYVQEWEDWDQIVETTKQGVTAVDGKVYGVPFSTDVQGLWYNKNLFEEAGLPVPFEPESWEDLLQAAEALKGIGEGDDFIPFFIYATKATGEATSMRTFQVLYSGTGSTLFDFDEEKWVFDPEALQDTFEFINTVYENDLGPSLSVASNSQVSNMLAEDLMMNDKIGMVIDGNWVAASWREGRATPWPEALDTWGFAKIPTQHGQDPTYTSMSGGWALSIPDKAQEKDLAWEFIKMAVDAEHQLDYVIQTGDMTVRSDIAEMDEYLDQPVSNYREAAEILEYTNFRPAVDEYPTVSTFIQEVVESVASGQVTPEQAVEDYKNGLIRLVEEDNIVEK